MPMWIKRLTAGGSGMLRDSFEMDIDQPFTGERMLKSSRETYGSEYLLRHDVYQHSELAVLIAMLRTWGVICRAPMQKQPIGVCLGFSLAL